MPAKVQLGKEWKGAIRKMTVAGRASRVAPSVSFALLDSSTGTLLSRVYGTRVAAESTAERINARRGKMLGSSAPAVTVVSVTSTSPLHAEEAPRT